MHALTLITLSLALSSGSAALMIAIDRRAAACPRPGDATVTAAVTVVDRPSDGQTGVTVTVANPGPGPVLTGMALRRRLLPGGRTRVTIGSRTTRRRYQAGRQAAVAAVPGEARRRLWVPVPGGCRRYRLTVVIGQSDGRLRVVSTPVTFARPVAAAATRRTAAARPFPRPGRTA